MNLSGLEPTILRIVITLSKYMHVYKGQLSINLKTEQHSIYRDIQRFLLQQIYYQVPLSVHTNNKTSDEPI
jgi:hypothetical protein